MKYKCSKSLMIFIALLLFCIVVFFAGAFYVHHTSDFVTSEDGLWRAGVYQPEISRNLWSGHLFYYGDEPVSDVVIECQTSTSDRTFRYETFPSTQRPDPYAKFLAGYPFSSYYVFHDLSYGNPEITQITITWTDAEGNPQEHLFQF